MNAIEAREMFAEHVRAMKLPEPERGYVFSLRASELVGELRFDFAWPDRKVGVKIDGEKEGRYERTTRYVAEGHGWRICLFTGEMVRCGSAIATVIAALAGGAT